MKRMTTIPPVKATVILLALIFVGGCNYGRMNDQDSVKTYERKIAAMDARTIPQGDSFGVLSRANPRTLVNPLPQSRESAGRGQRAYGYFCVQCHGVKLDGQGTVGQSFAPLPADLLSPDVLSRSDGELYAHTRLGFRRHPALFSTVSEGDMWAIILYMRSLKKGSS